VRLSLLNGFLHPHTLSDRDKQSTKNPLQYRRAGRGGFHAPKTVSDRHLIFSVLQPFATAQNLPRAARAEAGHSPVSGSVCDYFWAGYGGTYFWVDPKEKLFAVMMVQMDFEQSGRDRLTLREIVYGALVPRVY
jgi:CubicO group peptidase (beta-lactamase class C family)